jgi:hypothetical protein
MKCQIQLIRSKEDRTVLEHLGSQSEAEAKLRKWRKLYPDNDVGVVTRKSPYWITVLNGHGNPI